ncbi:MAG: HD domain-containing phosphohydrolase, partial [Solirubrobacteraceae bacterium]
RFTPEERAEMEEHTVCGHRIVMPIHGLRPTTLACVRHHHERWDGTGYPHGKAGEAIPLHARVFALADALDALTTDRPYRAAVSWAAARDTIREAAGSHFDPAIVAAYDTVPDEAFARIREGIE